MYIYISIIILIYSHQYDYSIYSQNYSLRMAPNLPRLFYIISANLCEYFENGLIFKIYEIGKSCLHARNE